MKKTSRVRSATQEDIDRLYGSGRIVLGSVVRPKPEPKPAADEQRIDDGEELVVDDS
jgi:hypothetical protein